MPTSGPQDAQPVYSRRSDFLADAEMNASYSDVYTHPPSPPPAPADLQTRLRTPMLRIPVPHAGGHDADEHALRTGVPPPSQTTPAGIHRPLSYRPSHIRRTVGNPGPISPRSASSLLATFVSSEPSRESSRHRKSSPAPNSMLLPTSTQPDRQHGAETVLLFL
jgi:hypothetical protein